MFTTGEAVGLAEWISDDTCLVAFKLTFSQNFVKKKLGYFYWLMEILKQKMDILKLTICAHNFSFSTTSPFVTEEDGNWIKLHFFLHDLFFEVRFLHIYKDF